MRSWINDALNVDPSNMCLHRNKMQPNGISKLNVQVWEENNRISHKLESNLRTYEAQLNSK